MGTYKSSSECQVSNFGSVNNLLCKLPFQATIAAFLAFMAFKFQNIEISALLTPNEAKFTKKYEKIAFLTPWPLIWPLRPLLAFFQFS